MTRLYLAGPMRGYDQFNFPAFDAAAEDLRQMGFEVVSPAEHDRSLGFDETKNSLDGFDVEKALAADFEMILNCDGIVLLPRWQNSEGARAERFVAEKTGRQVYEYLLEADQSCYGVFPAAPWDGNPTLDSSSGEVRVTNPDTGGAKGSKPARYDLLPAGPLWEVAELYGEGAKKYAARNWELGYDWSLSFAALQRHAWKFWSGEDIDGETGKHHLASVVFHSMSLMQFRSTHPELDDRPTS